ncbi:CgeB family protein, partial [Romboutsia sp.]|uniref:CgeB family protein n=1 Tax=Romboutsia sp. TaxID=1965302 RepID=UPI003F2D2733
MIRILIKINNLIEDIYKPYKFNINTRDTEANQLRKVACILDEFSYQCFKYECNLIDITPENWKKVILEKEPEILLVESYWFGNNGAWKHPDSEHLSQLVQLVKFCKAKNIPTVFWNKEDPYSFNGFLNMARNFDIVYTTAIECVNKYKEILGHNNVYLLPFAAQTAIHNPIEIYNSRKNSICFAGSYYRKKFPKRESEFMLIADIAKKYGLEIYDRHYGKNNDDVTFPDKYKENICGNLKVEEVEKAYKGYKYGINLNSINDSYTMFARRVLELMASNTLVISSYSKGMVEFFGDLTIHDENKFDLEENIKKFMNDELTYKKYRLLALRKVLENHTYKDRFNDIIKKAINVNSTSKWPSVAVIAFEDKKDEIKLIHNQFNKQNYKNKKLYIFSSFESLCNDSNIIYNNNEICDKTVLDIIKEEYISFFHRDDFYGANYLTDLMCGTLYAPQCDAIGKSSYYYKDPNLVLMINEGEYRHIRSLMYRNSIIKTKKISNYKLKNLSKTLHNKSIKESKMISIDCFNYIYNGNLYAKDLDNKYVLDIDDINIGKNIDEIENKYFKKNKMSEFTNMHEIDFKKLISGNINQVELEVIDDSLLIDSKMISTHQYIFYNIKPNNFEKVQE